MTLVVLLSASFAACDSSREEVVMASPAADIDLGISSELQSLLSRKSHIRLRLTETRMSGDEALDALVAGDVDFAIVSNFQPYRDGVATVMPLYPTVLHIAYRDGRDTSDGAALLHNATVFAGTEGSASRRIFEQIVKGLGLEENEYRFVENRLGDSGEPVDIAVAFAPISPRFRKEFAGYRFLTLGSPADVGSGSAADAAALANPSLRPFIIPVGTYGDATPEPVLTMAVDKILVARNDVDQSLVYDLIGEVLRLRPALSASNPALVDKLRDDFDVSHSTFVLHKGTQAFLRRLEPTTLERYSGAAEVAISVFIAAFSASIAGVRIWKRKRKNRIDKFYAAALRIRDTVNDTSSDDDKAAATAELRALQDDAFAQLIDERLDADESFRIFITLSDEILATLRA